jgi:dTDP-4-dehydrorhamnose 3,5-epimerase-like enzyme
MNHSLDARNLIFIDIPIFEEENGDLIFYQDDPDSSFKVVRVFVVKASKNSVRGKHSHKLCSQILICLNGRVEVICNDGINVHTYLLDSNTKGLMVPPNIWSEQIYKEEDSILMVLCNRLYSSDDYIRDFSEYSEYVSNNKY